MVTMLEVISRTKEKMEEILNRREELFKEAKRIVKEKNPKSIIFVGSGSSYSSALTAMSFVEKSSGLSTIALLPNIFIEKEVYDTDTLYVFVSQSGTSNLTLKAAQKLKEMGRTTLALSGNKESPIAKACDYFIEIAVGYEEYTYATLGYSLSAFTEMLLGMELGKARGFLTDEKYSEYIREAQEAAGSNHRNIEYSLKWFEKEKERLVNKQNFVIYGGKSLYGIANEGCLKMMEISKKYISVAYELDDGMHGPNYCLDERAAVFALNDGRDSEKCIALMNLMKKEYDSGFMIGKDGMDEHDLSLDIKTVDFSNLEMVSFVQVIAYLLAKENQVPIYTRDDPRIKKTKGKGYFNMHDVSKI